MLGELLHHGVELRLERLQPVHGVLLALVAVRLWVEHLARDEGAGAVTHTDGWGWGGPTGGVRCQGAIKGGSRRADFTAEGPSEALNLLWNSRTPDGLRPPLIPFAAPKDKAFTTIFFPRLKNGRWVK